MLETTMTERDKRLLLMLGCFVLLAGFIFGNIMLMDASDALAVEIETKEAEKQTMEDKVMRLNIAQIEAEESAKAAQERLTDYYPVMRSQELDREMTQLVLDEGLKMESLNIKMPEESLWVIPYVGSEMAKNGAAALEGEEEITQKEATDMAEDASEEELAGETEVQTNTGGPEGSIGQMTTMYAAEVSLTVSGSQKQFWDLIETLTGYEKALRITNMQMNGTKVVDDDKQWMDITVEFYMCAGEIAK